MPKKPKVRCVNTLILEVQRGDNKNENILFSYGQYYNAQKVEFLEDDPEYINVVLENGDRIDGVSRDVFEIFGAPVEVVKSTVKENVESKKEEEEEYDKSLIDLYTSTIDNTTPTTEEKTEEKESKRDVKNISRKRKE